MITKLTSGRMNLPMRMKQEYSVDGESYRGRYDCAASVSSYADHNRLHRQPHKKEG
jgi:hypothetical protein